MMQNKIKAIGFDYGGVVGIHKSVMPEIAEVVGVSLQDLRTIYFQHNQLANTGGLSYPELWDMILGLLNKADFSFFFHALLKIYDTPDLNPEVVQLITELRNQNYLLGLLSNNTKENAINMRNEGIDQMFDTFLISAEIGYQKPTKEAYDVLFQNLGVVADECVYIDDSPNSLKFASDIGFTPILFDNAVQLRTELVTLGILDN